MKLEKYWMALVFIFVSTTVFADVVYLKDGEIIEGKYISDTATGIYFEVEEDGRTDIVQFTYDEIETIDFSTTSVGVKKRHRERLEKKRRRERGQTLLEKIGISADGSEEKAPRDAAEEADAEEVVRQAEEILEMLGLGADAAGSGGE
mgnify:CR=1 FL=1